MSEEPAQYIVGIQTPGALERKLMAEIAQHLDAIAEALGRPDAKRVNAGLRQDLVRLQAAFRKRLQDVPPSEHTRIQ